MTVRSLDLNGAVAHTRAAVFAVDGRGRIALWNRAAEKLLGHAAGDVVGRPSCEVFGTGGDGRGTLCYRGCHPALISLNTPIARAELVTRTDAGQPIRLSVSALVIAGPGEGTTVMHLVREATEPDPPAPVNAIREAPGDGGPLSRREFDVLRLMGAGMNTRTIAGTLGLSEATVRNHVQRILGKLGVHSRLAAVATAHRCGILVMGGPEMAPHPNYTGRREGEPRRA